MAYYKCGSVYTTQNSNVVVDTASGAIANFQTPLAMPLLKTRFDFKATQDLHGQSGPYPAGGGINRWDEETVNGYLSSTDGSFISHNTSICSKNFNAIEPSTDYFLFKGSSTPATYVCLYDANYDFIKRESVGAKVTTPSNAAYFKISCYGYGATYKNDIGVNYPATDTKYHPYSNICPIDGVSEINNVHCSKNMFNKNDTNAILNAYIGVDIVSISLMRTVLARCKPNTKYTVSKNAGERFTIGYTKIIPSAGVEVFGRITNNAATSISITTGSDAKYMVAFVYNGNVDSGTPEDMLASVQIEEGDSTTYEPYNGSTTLINLGGTYYGGYVSQDKDGKRELVVTWCDITDLGSLNWGASNEGRAICNPSDMAIVPLSSIIGNILSNCYKPDTHNNVWNRITDNTIAVTNNPNAKMVLYDSNLGTKTSEEVKAYLSGKSVIYGLAEPFTVALPDGQPIKSLPGVNNIFADTGDTSLQFAKIGN